MNISKITSFIDKSMQTARKGFEKLPAILLICSSIQKPGISSMLATANIITRLGEIGLPTGPNEDGTPNIYNQIVRVTVEEIFDEIVKSAQLQVGVPYAGIPFVGYGANSGGPVTVTGFNTSNLNFSGCIF